MPAPDLRTVSFLSLVFLAACGGDAPPSGETVLSDPEGCPGVGNPEAAAGWDAYQAEDMSQAQVSFQAARDLCPSHLGARTGLGYVALRQGSDDVAAELFAGVVEDAPGNVDAHAGLGILAWRAGDHDGVRAHFGRVLELDPEHTEARDYLERVQESAGADPGGA